MPAQVDPERFSHQPFKVDKPGKAHGHHELIVSRLQNHKPDISMQKNSALAPKAKQMNEKKDNLHQNSRCIIHLRTHLCQPEGLAHNKKKDCNAKENQYGIGYFISIYQCPPDPFFGFPKQPLS
jgi:hypothetical protein